MLRTSYNAQKEEWTVDELIYILTQEANHLRTVDELISILTQEANHLRTVESSSK